MDNIIYPQYINYYMRGKTILILVMILSINFVVANPYSFNLYDDTTTSTSNISDFLDLSDTPSSYTGDGDKCVTVKNDETGLEFISCPSGGNGSGITNISQAGDVDYSGVDDNDVLRWNDAVKQWVASKLNSILSFGDDWNFFSGDNELSFNETKLNATIDARAIGGNVTITTNVSITYGTNTTNEIPILLTPRGKQIIVMSVDTITSQNATCTFVPSPDESVILEVCDA